MAAAQQMLDAFTSFGVQPFVVGSGAGIRLQLRRRFRISSRSRSHRADSTGSGSLHRICADRPAAYQRHGPLPRRSWTRAHRFCASGGAWSTSQEPPTIHQLMYFGRACPPTRRVLPEQPVFDSRSLYPHTDRCLQPIFGSLSN